MTHYDESSFTFRRDWTPRKKAICIGKEFVGMGRNEEEAALNAWRTAPPHVRRNLTIEVTWWDYTGNVTIDRDGNLRWSDGHPPTFHCDGSVTFTRRGAVLSMSFLPSDEAVERLEASMVDVERDHGRGRRAGIAATHKAMLANQIKRGENIDAYKKRITPPQPKKRGYWYWEGFRVGVSETLSSIRSDRKSRS